MENKGKTIGRGRNALVGLTILAATALGVVGCADSRNLSKGDRLMLNTYNSHRTEIDSQYDTPAKNDNDRMARGRTYLAKQIVENVGPIMHCP
ncbi:hypothetical protein HOA55_04390 [archaeon]|jgi:hypothetical protein|nr:hypothetical protein [archaeon]MBT3577965.1 hypothetical protein [archaeon]MBT6820568.1 hypothetical protein [archaeon]MBT6955760.1 hypothetical protein [archaeon]MBT7025819.1 hypothetical protein [archaeon]